MSLNNCPYTDFRILAKGLALGILLLIVFSCQEIDKGSIKSAGATDVDTVSLLIKQADSLSAVDFSKAEILLKRIIRDSNNVADTNKIKAIRNYGSLLFNYGKGLESLDYFKKCNRIAQSINDSLWMIRTYNDLGLANNYIGNYDTAVYFYTKALRISLITGRHNDYYKILINQSNSYLSKGESGKAFKLLVEASKLAYKIKDSVSLRLVYNNMAQIMAARKDSRSAIEYTRKALRFDSATQMSYHSVLMLNMGIYYSELQMPDSALYFYNQANPYILKTKDSLSIVKLIHNTAIVKLNTGKISEAEEDFRFVLDYSKRNSINMGIAMAASNLAEVKIKAGKYKEAISLLSENEPLIRKYAYPSLYPFYLNTIADAYEHDGNLKESIGFYKEYIAVQDSLKLIAKDDLLNEERIQLESLVKEKEVQLALHKLYSAQNAKRIQSYTIGGLLVVMLVLLILVYILRKQLMSKQYAYKALQGLYGQGAVVENTAEEYEMPNFAKPFQFEKASGMQSADQKLPDSSKVITDFSGTILIEMTDIQNSNAEDIRLKELKKILNTDKLFLNPELEISSIVKMLKISENELIKAIKDVHDLSFEQYINTFRLGYAIDLLNDSANNSVTIETIGAKSGFISKSIFVSLFQQYTGLPPVLYRLAVQVKAK